MFNLESLLKFEKYDNKYLVTLASGVIIGHVPRQLPCRQLPCRQLPCQYNVSDLRKKIILEPDSIVGDSFPVAREDIMHIVPVGLSIDSHSIIVSLNFDRSKWLNIDHYSGWGSLKDAETDLKDDTEVV